MQRTIFTFAAVVVFSLSSFATPKYPTLESGYTVTITKIKNTSPFCLAIAKGDFEMVKKMIELGSDVNELSNQKTPLMYAARYNRVEIAKLLLANGAELSTKDSNGNQAIEYAKQSNAANIITLFTTLKS